MNNEQSKITVPTEINKTEIVCPNDANPMSILQGGRLVQWMDIAAAVCAQMHTGKFCVTVSINDVHFKHPAKIGDIISIKALVSRTFNTSIRIFVQAHSWNVAQRKKKLINEAHFTFVALDNNLGCVSIEQPRHTILNDEKAY